LVLLGMSLMNMGLLLGKLKAVDVEPVSGSKFIYLLVFNVHQTQCCEPFLYGVGF
jgi:hypothetical protein